MIRLACDYQEGCHPKILERLVQTNLERVRRATARTFTVKAPKQKLKRPARLRTQKSFY